MFFITKNPWGNNAPIPCDDPKVAVAAIVKGWPEGEFESIQVRQEPPLPGAFQSPVVIAIIYPHVVANHLVASYCTGQQEIYEILRYHQTGNQFVIVDTQSATFPVPPTPR